MGVRPLVVRHTGSHAVEEYLEAIHRFGATAEGGSTTRLAEHLGVAPASVTGMLRRLRETGLITYRKYGEFALTAEGEARAHNLIRRHRLAERLLTDVLKVPLEEAHDEACRLEHALSPQLEARLATALGSPESCPHGHPIDAAAEDHTLPLADLPANRRAVIARLEDETPARVRYLSERGLVPGARVVVRKRDSLGEVLVVEVNGQTHSLALALARTLRIRRPGGAK